MSFKDEIVVLFKSHKKHLIAVLILGFLIGAVVCSCNKDHIPNIMEVTE